MTITFSLVHYMVRNLEFHDTNITMEVLYWIKYSFRSLTWQY